MFWGGQFKVYVQAAEAGHSLTEYVGTRINPPVNAKT